MFDRRPEFLFGARCCMDRFSPTVPHDRQRNLVALHARILERRARRSEPIYFTWETLVGPKCDRGPFLWPRRLSEQKPSRLGLTRRFRFPTANAMLTRWTLNRLPFG